MRSASPGGIATAAATEATAPPAALRGAMRGGRGAELDRARRWLVATAAEAGATVAVLGSSYGGLPGWDRRPAERLGVPDRLLSGEEAPSEEDLRRLRNRQEYLRAQDEGDRSRSRGTSPH